MSAGDQDREDLVLAHGRLADALARRFAGRGEPLEDLEQVARLGLVRAAERYDPDRGVPFGAFAVPTVVGELKRHFRDRTWTVGVPRRVRDLVPAVRSAAQDLRDADGRPPTVDRIAAHLGLEVEVVLEVMDAAGAYRPSSLDAGGPTVAEQEPSADHAARVAQREELRGLLHELDDRDRTVVLLALYADWTQQRIADQVGLSQEQVSRVLRRSLARLAELAGRREGDEGGAPA